MRPICNVSADSEKSTGMFRKIREQFVFKLINQIQFYLLYSFCVVCGTQHWFYIVNKSSICIYVSFTFGNL